jgi:hypothetical protein
MSYLTNVVFGNQDHTLLAVVPNEQLLNQSLHLVAPGKQFKEWSAKNHADSYLCMQRIANLWMESNLTNQYLIYGKVGPNPFKWEMVPYKRCPNFIGRAFQQIKVLWRTVFGGVKVSEKEGENQLKKYELLLKQFPPITKPSAISSKSDDSFCKDDTIKRQWVITGKTVNVLFNYAPIGFGGERLHFLVVPKEHRETFTEVTPEEYDESLGLTGKLIDHFTENRKTVRNVYL